MFHTISFLLCRYCLGINTIFTSTVVMGAGGKETLDIIFCMMSFIIMKINNNQVFLGEKRGQNVKIGRVHYTGEKTE